MLTMAKRKKSRKKKARRNIEREMADRFVESLRLVGEGVLSRPAWIKGWDANLGRQRNGVTGHEYRGINKMITSFLAHDHADDDGNVDPRWATKTQIRERIGWKWNDSSKRWDWTRDGEEPVWWDLVSGKMTPIVYYSTWSKEVENEAGEKEKKTRFFMRHYNVYNFNQIAWPEGREPKMKGGLEEDPRTSNERFDDVWNDHDPETHWGGDAAFYSKGDDTITLPDPRSFKSAEAYYSTALHELGHWTGSIKRLARDGICKTEPGRRTYAIEELIAEIASAFVCSALGIELEGLMHEEYVLNWAKYVDDDPKVLTTCCRKAQEIADYVLREEPPEYD